MAIESAPNYRWHAEIIETDNIWIKPSSGLPDYPISPVAIQERPDGNKVLFFKDTAGHNITIVGPFEIFYSHIPMIGDHEPYGDQPTNPNSFLLTLYKLIEEGN